MRTGMILLPMAAVMVVCAAACAWPAAFWIKAQPNYWMAGFGVVTAVAIVGLWLVLWRNDAAFEEAVEITAFVNNHLSAAERAEATQPNRWYERNSGLVRWANNQAGRAQRARYLAWCVGGTPPTETQNVAVRGVGGVNGAVDAVGEGGL